MEIYTVEHWQQNWDSLIARVENGETIGVTNGTNTAIMVPYQEYIETVDRIEKCTKI